MIQFKADCGHTIEVSDREAGRVVRCAYCGREVEAPTPEEPDGVLFEEVDLNELARGAGISADQSLTIHGRQRGGKASTLDEVHAPGKMGMLLMTGYAVLGLVLVVLAVSAVIRFGSSEQAAGPQPERLAVGSPLQDLPMATLDPPVQPRRPPPDAEDHAPTGEAAPEESPPDEPEAAAFDENLAGGEVTPEESEEESGVENRPRSGKRPWGSPSAATAQVEAPASPGESEAHPDRAEEVRPSRRSPWDRRSRGAAAAPARPPAGRASFANVLKELRERLAQGLIARDEWAQYLCGGAQHALWQNADPQARADFVDLIDADAAAELIQPLGHTFLGEPALEIRLALLELMVQTHDQGVIRFIDQRLATLTGDADLSPAQADTEAEALHQGRDALTAVPSRKSPWNNN